MSPRTLVPLLLGAGLLALAVPLATPIASACGAFFHVRTIAPEQRPSLAREKVLIIHDTALGQQHFIREVAFRRAEQTFGFVRSAWSCRPFRTRSVSAADIMISCSRSRSPSSSRRSSSPRSSPCSVCSIPA